MRATDTRLKTTSGLFRARKAVQLGDVRHVAASTIGETARIAEWERYVVSHMPFMDWCKHRVAGRDLERGHEKQTRHDDQYPLVCIDCMYLSALRETELRTRMQLRSWQSGWTCWDRHS